MALVRMEREWILTSCRHNAADDTSARLSPVGSARRRAQVRSGPPALRHRGLPGGMVTPEQRILRARLAAHERWARDPDRAQPRRAYKSSPASVDYWLDRVDPEGTMAPEARRKVAASKRNAYMARLVFKSSRHHSRRTGDDA